jgi:beta-lactam-binding protein with PASTA domain
MPSITDSIGRVLGDRYRLVTALGTGASAHVYLADDVSLHRPVAIKVLHPGLSGDRAFLKRFQAEAQAVAGLNHPNILQVYDWGSEAEEPYLVLEYLAGGSLRQVFDTGALLTPEQAVRVGLQAASGLEYAHKRGLIHRDIKPANLLFDADQRLRIADFGLARALAEAAWTEPEGAMLGTARYASPEQVENFVLDGKVDIYALALVLYEGVTGEAPFIGDTIASTLGARMGSLLPEHEALGPLYDVLVWAAAPEPSERYDAAKLLFHLEALALILPKPEPLPILEAVSLDQLEEAGRAMGRPVVKPANGLDNSEFTELGAPALVTPGKRGPTPVEPKVKKARGRRRWPWVTAALVVALVIAGVVAATQTKLFTPSHPVPVLVGKTMGEATKAVSPDHFNVRESGHTFSITLATGLIISQSPAAATKAHQATAKQGSTIAVVVSDGPPPVAIPALTSFSSCNDAVQALVAVHLVGTCPAAAAQYSSTVPAGGILGTSPTKTAPYGSTVTIVTSKGHAPLPVPTVNGNGSTYATASAALTASGFAPSQSHAYSSTVPTGQVISTTPDATAGPVAYGSKVVVNVSLGPQPVTVPNELGKSVTAATSALEALGLKVAGPYGPPGSTTVLSTDPVAGTSVPPGTTVNLYTL